MGLFNIFNKKDKKNYNIEFVDTKEEYIELCKKIVNEIIEIFLEFHNMEKEAMKRDNFDKIRDKKSQKLKLICTEELYNKITVDSYGSPTNYEFLVGGCKIYVTMKSNKKFYLYFVYNYATNLEKTKKYEIKIINNNWFINKQQYRFKSSEDWIFDRGF